jgi:hypothetical protein
MVRKLSYPGSARGSRAGIPKLLFQFSASTSLTKAREPRALPGLP